MSRIGKKPVSIPSGVKVSVSGRDVTVEKGSNKLSMTHRPECEVQVDEESREIVIIRKNDTRVAKAMHGLTRSLIQNMVIGVTEGYTKELEINGVGWTAKVQGMKVNLNLGYADTKVVDILPGVTVEVTGNRVKVTGTDKHKVGQVAANIRAQRKPEPYNGRGVKYVDEVITRKQGKAFAGG